jgi:hypothetical protein
MHNVGVAFEVLEDGKSAPQGWTKASGHITWDLKMDFTRKASWVLDGHKLSTPEGSIYAGVVSRESVRISLTYAARNGLEVCAADIRNAYLQAPSSCKDYINTESTKFINQKSSPCHSALTQLLDLHTRWGYGYGDSVFDMI